VADITRRVDICRAANERYLEALGVVGAAAPTHQLFDPASKRITRRGRSYRGLRPVASDEAKTFATLPHPRTKADRRRAARAAGTRRRAMPSGRVKTQARRARDLCTTGAFECGDGFLWHARSTKWLVSPVLAVDNRFPFPDTDPGDSHWKG
jgi:hypothetical protein